MAWLPNGQYQNLSRRVKDGTSCFLASKIPLDEDGVSNNENTDLVFKRTRRKIKSKKKRSDRKLGLSPPGTRHHLHLRSTAGLEEAESFLQHRCLRTGGCADRSHQNKISTIRVHAKKLKMSLKKEDEEIDVSDKSSGSKHSGQGRGSSHFPWSPVQMLKSDDLSPKKQKPIALGFQCCLKTSTLLGYSVSA
ncbi:hypothetical protein Bca4012_052981 [Brassica carinata]